MNRPSPQEHCRSLGSHAKIAAGIVNQLYVLLLDEQLHVAWFSGIDLWLRALVAFFESGVPTFDSK